MQYTSSSFADLLLRRFTWVMFPRGHRPELRGALPPPSGFHSVVPDTVLDLVLLPCARAYAWVALRARLLYLRRLPFQIVLVVATLVVALAWSFSR
jgi:hydrogenase-4 component B